MRTFIVLLITTSTFSPLASANKTNSLRSSIFSLLSDYGIPLAAETGLEATAKIFEPVRNAAVAGICGTGPAFYACWFASGLIDLQRFNIQSGLSKHLEDKVSSLSQATYNSLFAPEKPKGAVAAAQKMESLRNAATTAQSMESIKARITLAQIKPIFDSLFAFASFSVKKNNNEGILQSARTIAYAAVLLAAYAPEYEGDEPEIALTLIPLLKNLPITFRGTIEKEISRLVSQQALSDVSVGKRLQSILCKWFKTKDESDKLCQLFHDDSDISHLDLNAVHSLTWVGLVAPTLFFNLFPQQHSLGQAFTRTALNSISQNLGEAATRVDATDFFANVRRTVQRLGLPDQTEVFRDSESYLVLRARQFKASRGWSELGLRMRANLLRYLAIVIPAFTEASMLHENGKIKESQAVLASLFSYIRQYNPEYTIDNVYLRTAGYGILTPALLLDLTEFWRQLEKYDHGYAADETVKVFYNQTFASLLDPLSEARIDKHSHSPIPWLSCGLSLFADLSHVAFTRAIIHLTQASSPGLKIVAKEAYSRFGGVIVRGIGEPAKEDIQQALASNDRTLTEEHLVSGSVEMNGRAGGDAQRARAIYERIEPVLFHLFSEAREEYQRGQMDAAARLVAYSTLFLAYYYPEVPADDALIADVALARFSQFLDPSQASEFSILITKHLLYYDKLDPILACNIESRLLAFGLPSDTTISNACEKSVVDDSLSERLLLGAKTAVYYGGIVAAMMLPAFAALTIPRQIVIQGAPTFVNFAASCTVLGTAGLTLRSIFNGITSGLTSNSKSWAQRKSQHPRTTTRIDEIENGEKAQNYFGNIQWDLQQFLSPYAQEGRKDLLLVAQNIAQSLRNVKVAQSLGEDGNVHEQSLHDLLHTHYYEGKAIYGELLSDMRYAFLGEQLPKPSPIDFSSKEKDEL